MTIIGKRVDIKQPVNIFILKYNMGFQLAWYISISALSNESEATCTHVSKSWCHCQSVRHVDYVHLERTISIYEYANYDIDKIKEPGQPKRVISQNPGHLFYRVSRYH